MKIWIIGGLTLAAGIAACSNQVSITRLGEARDLLSDSGYGRKYTYTNHLSLAQLNGTPSQWITVTGPESGPPAVFVADPGPRHQRRRRGRQRRIGIEPG